MSAPSFPVTSSDRATHWLRIVLRLNAGFSLATGALALVAGGAVADLLGIEQVWLVRLVGAGLLGFAALVAAASRLRPVELRQQAALISIADLGWVAATIGVVAAGWLSTAGVVVMGLVAVLVLDLGVAQLFTRHRMRPVA